MSFVFVVYEFLNKKWRFHTSHIEFLERIPGQSGDFSLFRKQSWHTTYDAEKRLCFDSL